MHETTEREKYLKMWRFEKYRKNSPGERLVDDAALKLRLDGSERVIDFGCGTGRAAQAFADRGHNVIGVDIAENCLDDVVDILLIVQPLWDELGISADVGFCTDVMEHIPTEHVDDVLHNIACSVDRCYFQIATFKDGMGKLIGDTLHMTVKPAAWWREVLEAHFSKVQADQKNGGVIAVCES